MSAQDGKALLRAILDEPADDTHRLVYADWLECEGGDPELAYRIRRMVANPLESRLVMAGQTVRVDLDGEPPLTLGCPLRGMDDYVVWRRGFIAQARTTLQEWMREGPALAAWCPFEFVFCLDLQPTRAPNSSVANSWHAYDPRDYAPAAGSAWSATIATTSATIPFDVYELLQGGSEGKLPGGRYRSYPSERLAVVALSAALIGWAKGASSEVQT